MSHSPASSLRSSRIDRRTRRNRVSFAVLTFALLAAASAHAQSTPPAQTPAKPADKTAPAQTPPAGQAQAGEDSPTVTITGTKPPVQHKADRDVYDVKNDPQAQSGAAADVLNNVPSVSVDPQGNVALRGNSNVQVYVNGKPSAEMQGDNRAASLQSMSAGDIDSVEVITNPSAQFGADTGGGIINIVMKRNRRPGGSANIRANIGNDGRYNSQFSGNYTKGPMTLSFGANVRHEIRDSVTDSLLDRLTAPPGSTAKTTQHSTSSGEQNSTGFNVGVDYNLSDYDTISARGNYTSASRDGSGNTHSQGFDSNSVALSDYNRETVLREPRINSSAQLEFDHRGKADGEDFKVQYRHSESTSDSNNSLTNTYVLPVQPALANRVERFSETVINDISGDYVRPLSSDRALGLGWDVQGTKSDFNNQQTLQDLVGAPEHPDPVYSNRFKVDQTLTAAYVTYQTPLGKKWQLLAGLRVEDMQQTLHQVTTGDKINTSQITWSPSLHFTYPLTESTKLRASYSHKINRPQAQALNPFLVYRDPLNVSSGNPFLKPQQIDSFEFGYLASKFTANLYYNQSQDTIASTTSILPGNVLLTTRENAGRSRSAGGEYTINSKINDKLSYSLSLNVFYQELESIDRNSHLPVKNTGVSYTNNGSLTYSPTKADQFQLRGIFVGPQLDSQGSRSGFTMVNLSYSHTLTPKLKLLVIGNDLLNSQKFHSETTNSLVHTVSDTESPGQIIFVGLSYTLGNAPGRDRQGQGQFRMRGQGGQGGDGGYGGPGGPGGY